MPDKEKNSILFAHLVVMFHAAAMQQLGKIKNLITDTIERDLVAAQNSIDMLEMLKERTKGNLTPEEDRMLSEILRELRLNYVDELNKPEPQEKKESEEGKGDTKQEGPS